MSDLGKTMKEILIRSAQFVGSSAKKLVKETKFKTSELSDLGKRRDLIVALGEKVYELSKNSTDLPEEISDIIKQLAALDNDLAVLRADHAAQKAADAQQRAAEKAARAAEKAAAKAAAAIEQSTAPVNVELPKVETTSPEQYVPQAPTMDIAGEVPDESAGNDAVPTLEI